MSRVHVVVVERRSPLWVGSVQGCGVWVQGRSLKDVANAARAALLLAFGEEAAVEVRVRDARADALAQSRARYQQDLVDTVRFLRASRVSWVDIRKVTGEPPAKIRALLAREEEKQAPGPESPQTAAPDRSEEP